MPHWPSLNTKRSHDANFLSLTIMQLLDLPNELVSLISEFLDGYSINALLQTCRRLFLLLNRSLYHLNVRCSHACSLEWAAKHGFETTARYALVAGASPNAAHYEEWVPMALSCIHGHEGIVRLLLDYGVDPNALEGWTHFEGVDEAESGDHGYPMALAAGRGHEHIIKLLLAYGASVDTPTEELGDTPLAIAARKGHLSIVKLLVGLGCDIHVPGFFGQTLLSDAAHEGHSEVVRYFLEMNANIESPQTSGYTALCHAASEGYLDIVDLLLKHGMNPTPRVRNLTILPLAMAAQNGHHAVVERLRRSMDLEGIIAYREPSDDDHKELFLVSAACGWEELIGQLLERGYSPNIVLPESYFFIKERNPRGQYPLDLGHASPLALAAHRGHLGVVKQLLHYNADLYEEPAEKRVANPLFLAIDGAHKSIVNTLLDHGADPNHRIDGYRIDNSETVLFKAVRTPETFQLLLNRGADPQIQTKRGESVLVRALETRSITAVKILQGKVPLEVPPPPEGYSSTPLLVAAASGGVSMMEYLLDGGYQVVPGGREVEDSLYIILSRADVASLSLLFERGLVGNLSTVRRQNLLGLVESPTGDSEAATATMDTLLAYGIKMDSGFQSPFYEVLLRKFGEDQSLDIEVHFQLLLDRGADPLRSDGKYGTPLGSVANYGCKRLVQIMLKSLDQRSIPLEELQRKLASAERGAVKGGHLDIVPLLQL